MTTFLAQRDFCWNVLAMAWLFSDYERMVCVWPLVSGFYLISEFYGRLFGVKWFILMPISFQQDLHTLNFASTRVRRRF